jgi:hypothetical protein
VSWVVRGKKASGVQASGDFGDFEEKNCKIKELMNIAAVGSIADRGGSVDNKKSVNIIYCAQCSGL